MLQISWYLQFSNILSISHNKHNCKYVLFSQNSPSLWCGRIVSENKWNLNLKRCDDKILSRIILWSLTKRKTNVWRTTKQVYVNLVLPAHIKNKCFYVYYISTVTLILHLCCSQVKSSRPWETLCRCLKHQLEGHRECEDSPSKLCVKDKAGAWRSGQGRLGIRSESRGTLTEWGRPIVI